MLLAAPVLAAVPFQSPPAQSSVPITDSGPRVSQDFARLPSPLLDAGVYHLATGTWTRTEGAASTLGSGGSTCIYDNTSPSGYVSMQHANETWIASGRIASTSSPNDVWQPQVQPVGSRPGSARGCQDAYRIDGFQIAYCSNAVGEERELLRSDEVDGHDPAA
jgi:hypothetical protein